MEGPGDRPGGRRAGDRARRRLDPGLQARDLAERRPGDHPGGAAPDDRGPGLDLRLGDLAAAVPRGPPSPGGPPDLRPDHRFCDLGRHERGGPARLRDALRRPHGRRADPARRPGSGGLPRGGCARQPLPARHPGRADLGWRAAPLQLARLRRLGAARRHGAPRQAHLAHHGGAQHARPAPPRRRGRHQGRGRGPRQERRGGGLRERDPLGRALRPALQRRQEVGGRRVVRAVPAALRPQRAQRHLHLGLAVHRRH